jgi:hypothetical protein
MKKFLIIALAMVIGLVGSVNASQKRDTTINIYGVGARTDSTQKSHAGAGIMLDSEIVKLKVEGTSDYIKSGLVLKYNPFTKNWYFKVGANYINQKMYAPDDSTARVNQYSTALATGYMVMDDLYVEIGGSATQLKGSMIGADYEVKNERTSLAYLEVAKRWETTIGTIDTTANAGRVYHELSKDENSYGGVFDYYPLDNAKLGYKYQYEKNNISNVYSAQYGLLFAEYADNLSTKTYQVNAGVKIAFTDITDFSTYAIPQNIKPHLSELHRFEAISFGTNMNVQSTNGVEVTQAAINREAADNTITAPTLSSKTTTTLDLIPGTLTHANGVRNVTVELYSDAALTTLVGTNANGDFTGLSSSVTYYSVTTGEALNAFTNVWEKKTSATFSVTTGTPAAPPPAISTPTISLANQSVNDGGGLGSVDLPAPTVTGVVAGAVYSIVGDPTGGKLTINAGTGVATWNGDLFADTDYSITIKVVNPDTGTSTTTFTLTVIDNG